MVFCVREIEALRLLGWCQYIRPAQLLRVVSETELSNLLTMKLIKYHTKSKALILTAEGRRLLTGNIAAGYAENVPCGCRCAAAAACFAAVDSLSVRYQRLCHATG